MVDYRAVAGSLAAVGVLWGLFCLIFVASGSASALLHFAPGYLVTAGYFWRAVAQPSDRKRLFIWAGSAIVQGAWLLTLGLPVAVSGFREGGFGMLVVGWWTLSFVASVTGLAADRRRSDAG